MPNIACQERRALKFNFLTLIFLLFFFSLVFKNARAFALGDVVTPIVTVEEKTQEEESVEEEVAKEEAAVEEIVGTPETQTETIPFDGTSLSDTLVDTPDEPIVQTNTTTSTTTLTPTDTTTTTTAEVALPSGGTEEVKVGSTTPVGDTQATVDLNPVSNTQEEIKVGAETPVGGTEATVDLNPPSGTQEEVKVGAETPTGGTGSIVVDIGGSGSGSGSQTGNTGGSTTGTGSGSQTGNTGGSTTGTGSSSHTGGATTGTGSTGTSGGGSSGTGSAGSNKNQSLLGKIKGFFSGRQKEDQKITEGKSSGAAAHARRFDGSRGQPLSHKISKSENCQNTQEGNPNCAKTGAK